MAGGSQLIINKNGITFITPSRFEVRAGQHLFQPGEKVNITFPELSTIEPLCEECLQAAAVSGASYVSR